VVIEIGLTDRPALTRSTMFIRLTKSDDLTNRSDRVECSNYVGDLDVSSASEPMGSQDHSLVAPRFFKQLKES
jgi:hypothetical protein